MAEGLKRRTANPDSAGSSPAPSSTALRGRSLTPRRVFNLIETYAKAVARLQYSDGVRGPSATNWLYEPHTNIHLGSRNPTMRDVLARAAKRLRKLLREG